MPEPSIQRVWAVFDAALQVPLGLRQNFVAAQCGEDASLLDEVLELLEYHTTIESSDSFRASQSAESTASNAGDDLVDFPGTSRYVVERRLGSGGFGVVYQVRDTVRGSIIALKTLRNLTVESLFRFKREFRALADVAHPNLVQLYELGYDQRRWFFTMELVNGQRFLHHVWYGAVAPDAANAVARRSNRSYGADQAVLTRLRVALRQLVEGLDALHRSGHLHRDIKPSNVLVSTSGRVVLVDFGLALEVGSAAMRQSLTIAGTPAYMSPEQAAGLPLSSASDFYSVGVMLYEALTGTVPHDGQFLEMLIRKQQVDAPPPSATVPEVPPALDELCTALLHRDPEARPRAEGVLDYLGWTGDRSEADRSRARISAGSKVPFVGRERELALLQSAFAAMLQGVPRIAGISGASGIGKSALVRRFLENLGAERADAVVLSGRCYEQEAVPYKALDSLVDALSRYLNALPSHELEAILPRDTNALAMLFPVLGWLQRGASLRFPAPADSQESRRRAYAALRELLARLGDRHPLVLSIDDLQWGDVDSAALLTEVVRPPDPPSILVLASYRDVELATSPFLRAFLTPELLNSPTFVPVDVAPLGEGESARLAAALLTYHAASAQDAEVIAIESGGSPFFIDELVRFGETSAPVTGEDRPLASRPDSDEREASLANILQIRLSRLPEPLRRILQLVSVNGRPVPEHLLRAAAAGALSESDLLVLRSEHLLRVRDTDRGMEIEPYHDRIREIVTAGLSQEQLHESHLALGTAFEFSSSADPELLAQHFLGAGRLSKAAQYTVSAAESADQALAFDRAARLYRQALTLSDPEAPACRSLAMALASALINAGRGAEAAGVLLVAANDAPGQAVELRAKAAQQLLFSGQLQRGLDVLEGVLRSIGMSLPRNQWDTFLRLAWGRLRLGVRGLRISRPEPSHASADALMKVDACWSVAAALSMVDTTRGALFQTRHLLMALKAGELERVHRALCLELAFRAARGQSDDSVRRVQDQLDEVGARVDTPYARALHRLALATRDYLRGRWSAALAGMDESETLFTTHCTGVTWETDTARLLGLWALYQTGDLNSARARQAHLIADASDRGDLYVSTALRAMFSHLVDLANDDAASALRHTEDALASWSQPGFHSPDLWALYALVQIALYEGRSEDAWGLVERRWPALRKSTLLMTPFLAALMHDLKGRAALAVASRSADPSTTRRMRQVVLQCVRTLDSHGSDWAESLALILRAGLAHLNDEARSSEPSLLSQAETVLARANMRLLAAAVRRQRAGLPDSQDRRLLESAEERMREQHIVAPSALTHMYLPWIVGPARRSTAGI